MTLLPTDEPAYVYMQGRLDAFRMAITLVMGEPEAPGRMPLLHRIKVMAFPAHAQRAAIRATKRAIVSRLREEASAYE